ncbi:MAG: hypothetical protein AB7P24_20245 [Nitrospira sp.]
MEIERTTEEWQMNVGRLKWGAVIAGLLIGFALQMTLMVLGMAVGAGAVDVDQQNPVAGIPTGTAVWTAVAMLLSAFAGGYTAARLSGSFQKAQGLWHAVVLWALTWVISGWLATTAMSFAVGGVLSAFGSAVGAVGQTVGSVVSSAANQAADASIEIDTGRLRQQIESVLATTGKPELQPKEIRKDAERVAQDVREGKPFEDVKEETLNELEQRLTAFDRHAALNIMTGKMGMSREQAEEVVTGALGMLAPLKKRVNELKENSADMAQTAADRAETVAWWVFILAVVTLGASLGGGLVGFARAPLLELQGAGERRHTSIAS